MQGFAGTQQQNTLCPVGRTVFAGRCSALKAALGPRASRLGLRRAAIAARAARPNLSPRAERRQRPASSTSDRAVAGVLDHQGDEHRSKVTASRRENSKAGTCRAWGEVHSPSPAHEWPEVSRNLSRAPTASLRDRLRRHLTEPVRPGKSQVNARTTLSIARRPDGSAGRSVKCRHAARESRPGPSWRISPALRDHAAIRGRDPGHGGHFRHVLRRRKLDW